MCFKILCSAITGIILDIIFNFPSIILLGAAFSSLILAWLDNRALLIACSALFGLNSTFHGPVMVPDRSREMVFSGTVIGEDHRENGVKLSVILNRAIIEKGDLCLPLGVEFFSRSSRTLLGKSLLFKGTIRSARSSHGRNLFVGSIVGEEKNGNRPLGRIFFSVRSYIDILFRRTLPDPSYDLASGLVLGGSGRVGAETRSMFTRAGVLHILSVSGLHVGFLIGFLGFCLVLLPLPPLVKFLITAVFLFVYAGITGFIPTVLRAGLMGLFFGWALIQERNVDGLHIVNLTALILLAAAPRIIVDLGAQLSFASIYGIVGFFPKLKERIIDRIRIPQLKSLATLMGISASAQICVTPWLIHYFQRIQTMAVFSNLLIVPLSSLITYLLFAMIITGWISLTLASIVGMGVDALLKVLVAVSRIFAGLPGAAPVLILPFPVLILSYFFLTRRFRKPAVWGLVVVVLVLSLSDLPGTSVLRLEADQARLVMPDRSSWSITDREVADHQTFDETETVDYLVAPARNQTVKNGFYELPDELNFKKITIGDWTIDVRKRIVLQYRDRIWELGDTLLKPDEKIYVVVRGGRAFQFSEKRFESPVVRSVTELKLIYFKIRLLIG